MKTFLALILLLVAGGALAAESLPPLVSEGEPYDAIQPLLRNISRHAPVTSIAFSSDNRTLASGSDDGIIRLWDLASYTEVARLEGHSNAVNSVAFSPDGKTLASSSRDDTVRLWDLATHREIGRLEGHTGYSASVAFSPDGKTLASSSRGDTVRLWDLATKREAAPMKGHTDSVYSVAFSPDGKTLASGSSDKTVRLWDLASHREAARLEGHTGTVNSVAFSPEGKTLASGSVDKTVRLWNVATHRGAARLEGHTGPVWSIAFSRDGKTVASGSWDGTVRLWDVATQREAARLEGHTDKIYSVAFSPDRKILASGSGDGTVHLWDLATHREAARLESHTGTVNSVAFSRDGKTLASGADDNTIRLWDLGTHREAACLEGHTGPVRSIAFSPDGKTLASGADDNTVRLWDLATHREAARLEGHTSHVWSVAFSPDSITLASGSLDGTVRLWDLATYREVACLDAHSYGVSSVAFSPDGSMLASGFNDNTVRLWYLVTHREVAHLKGHADQVYSVAFSPDGKLLASGSKDKTVRLWELTTYREAGRLDGHTNAVTFVAFSPDGKILASGSWDKTVRIWDMAAQREAARLEGHTNLVIRVAFSLEGRTLASGSRDRIVFWDMKTRNETDVLIRGGRGTWVWCAVGAGLCWRGDDGTLIVETDEAGRLSSHKPPGTPQELAITLDRSISAVVYAGEVLEISARVHNKGTGRAYWLRLVPVEDTTADIAARPWVFDAPTLSILEPGGNETLTARVHLHTSPVNPARVRTVLRLGVRQAYGGLTDLPPLAVEAIPPLLNVLEARLLKQGYQQALAVTIANHGPVLFRTAFRLNVPGLEQNSQPAELNQERIAYAGQVTLSFGLPPELKLPRDLKVDLFGHKLLSPGGVGPPSYDWEFKNLEVIPPSLPWMLYAAAFALLVALGGMVYYQKVYRHPLVVRLTATPEAIRELDLAKLGSARKSLQRARRLNSVLETAGVSSSWLDHAAAFDTLQSSEERCRVLAERLGYRCEGPLAEDASHWKLELGEDFPLNLRSLPLYLPDAAVPAQDALNRLSSRGEVAMVLGATQEQQQVLAREASRRSRLLVAPEGPELTALLLAEQPVEELARLIARHVPVTQLSPYQTGGGVAKQNLFFGRGALIAGVMERDPANYLVVGGRQVGKSSMLKELDRRYRNDPNVVCHYLVLSDRSLLRELAESMGLPDSSPLKEILDSLCRPKKQRTLLLIDEADAFVRHDRQQGYELLQRLRAVSEEGCAHFILAGFWELYEQAVLDYQSPLLNFGAVLTVGPLEVEACRALAVEPMARLNVRWETEELVQRLIVQTGQRANLIATACDEVLNCLGERERIISARHLDEVLSGKKLQDCLVLRDLSSDTEEQLRDRIVVYAAACGELRSKARFTLAHLIRQLEGYGYTPSPEDLKRSLARLELACVFGKEQSEYFFQVPLQRDLVMAEDPELLLQRELRGAGLAYEPVRE